MALDCLVGYIGIDATSNADSGLYVTALPEVSIQSISKIADSDQEGYAGVMADVELRSIKRFRTLFIIELNRCWKISNREIAETLICSNKELLAESLWYLIGSELMSERINSSRINKFTTVDRAKAQELKADFEELFRTELATAVAGLDISGIDPPQPGGFISVSFTSP